MPESYVNGQMTAAESDAFEEHFFACAECWNAVEVQRKLRAGVRDAVRNGRLEEAAPAPHWRWAFVAAACALVAFASWTLLVRIPQLEQQLAAARTPVAQQKVEVPVVMAQANLPVLMLEASRSDTATAFALPAGAPQFAVWLDAPVGAGRPFRLEIAGPGGPVTTLAGLTPNAQGALTGSLPAAQLAPGKYTARLYGSNGALAGEYGFVIKR